MPRKSGEWVTAKMDDCKHKTRQDVMDTGNHCPFVHKAVKMFQYGMLSWEQAMNAIVIILAQSRHELMNEMIRLKRNMPVGVYSSDTIKGAPAPKPRSQRPNDPNFQCKIVPDNEGFYLVTTRNGKQWCELALRDESELDYIADVIQKHREEQGK